MKGASETCGKGLTLLWLRFCEVPKTDNFVDKRLQGWEEEGWGVGHGAW